MHVNRRRGIASLLALAVAGLVGCVGGPDPISTCAAADGLTPVCGFTNPEDLVRIDDEWMLVSEMSQTGSGGEITAYRPSDDKRVRLHFEGESFLPHGIDLSLDGSRLAVVDHGEGETIEEFAVSRDDAGVPTLSHLRSLSIPEEFDANINDVAYTPTGFVFTKMMSANALKGSLGIATGSETGQLFVWNEDGGFAAVNGTGGVGPNGVASAADGGRFYMSEWGESRVVAFAPDGSARAESGPLGFSPDNLTWAPDGSLLVAGQIASPIEATACFEIPAGTTCGLGTGVARLDPATLEITPVLIHHPATVAGGASVALEHGGKIWIGTFGGDRLAWMVAP